MSDDLGIWHLVPLLICIADFLLFFGGQLHIVCFDEDSELEHAFGCQSSTAVEDQLVLVLASPATIRKESNRLLIPRTVLDASQVTK